MSHMNYRNRKIYASLNDYLHYFGVPCYKYIQCLALRSLETCKPQTFNPDLDSKSMQNISRLLVLGHDFTSLPLDPTP